MKPMENDWYKKIWTLDIQNQSWVEDTKRQIDFVIEKLHLTGNEKILDLACGFGRHSLELARRGFSVTGVDITSDYIRFAKEKSQEKGLCANFLCCDIRELQFDQEFDVVLNMADAQSAILKTIQKTKKYFLLYRKR